MDFIGGTQLKRKSKQHSELAIKTAVSPCSTTNSIEANLAVFKWKV